MAKRMSLKDRLPKPPKPAPAPQTPAQSPATGGWRFDDWAAL